MAGPEVRLVRRHELTRRSKTARSNRRFRQVHHGYHRDLSRRPVKSPRLAGIHPREITSAGISPPLASADVHMSGRWIATHTANLVT